jgi:hypothetical protein
LELFESLSSMVNAGNEKSTDAFLFRKGLLPAGEILTLRLLFVALPLLLFPSPDAENSMLLPNPTALPAMLPSDPDAPKSSEEPRRGRIVGKEPEGLFLVEEALA